MHQAIIQIEESKCNGCGACAAACHEGAIGMVGGKAKLLRAEHCDGLGDCLPVCPTGAITISREEAPQTAAREPRACPGLRFQAGGALANWPIQLRLVPAGMPELDGARLLVAADCAAYACPGFYQRFQQGRVTLIGCPKLDDADYGQKLAALLLAHQVKSVTVARMEVPCCGGLQHAVVEALARSGAEVPVRVVTLGVDGAIRREEGACHDF